MMGIRQLSRLVTLHSEESSRRFGHFRKMGPHELTQEANAGCADGGARSVSAALLYLLRTAW